MKPKKARKACVGLLRNRAGAVRLPWLWLIGFIVYFAWNWGAQFAFGLTLGRLHSHAMNLNYNDAVQAPLWASMVLRGYEPLLAIVQIAGTIAIFFSLKRLLHNHGDHEGFDLRCLGRWTLLGLGAALAGTLLCLLTDSLRLELPLSEPRLSLSLLEALPVCLLATMAGEVFMMDYLYESARSHLRLLPSIVLLVAVEFIAEAGWHLSWIGRINVILQILLCCELHDRYGLAAPTGLWFGWGVVQSAVFSMDGSGVWTAYCVSESWLTGGSHGLFNGACMTALLVGVLLWLKPWRRWQRRDMRTTAKGECAKSSR